MRKQVYCCDVTGSQFPHEENISFDVVTPQAKTSKHWGEIDIHDSLVPDSLSELGHHHKKDVGVFVEGKLGMGGRTALPKVIGIFIPRSDEVGMDKTTGIERCIEEWGEGFIEDLETAVKHRYVQDNANIPEY